MIISQCWRKKMLDKLIDEYVTILDRDPLDHSESTDVILEAFANKVIQAYLKEPTPDNGQSNYYKKQHSLWID